MNSIPKDQQRIIDAVMSRNPRTIDTKQENYALYQAGIYGNKPLIWNSYKEILDSGWNGGVCIRSRKGMARGKVKYNLTIGEVPDAIRKYAKKGQLEKDLTFNQNMPDEHLTIQGEVSATENHLNLIYTTIQEPMLKGLNKERIYEQGLIAMHTLRRNLDAPSFENLMNLLRMFPGSSSQNPSSSVEFSTYEIGVGDLGNNTVFWEVRNY